MFNFPNTPAEGDEFSPATNITYTYSNGAWRLKKESYVGPPGATGPVGPVGPIGVQGISGPAGAVSIFKYNFNTAIVEPPAASEVRFNNATMASVTKLWVYNTTSDAKNANGFMYLVDSAFQISLVVTANSAQWVNFNVTGPTVNKTTYVEIPVSFHSTGTAIPNAAALDVSFFDGSDYDGTRYPALMDIGIRTPVLVSRGGRGYYLGSGGVQALPDGTLQTPDWNLQIVDTLPGDTPYIVHKTKSGKAMLLAQPPIDPLNWPTGGSSSGSSNEPLFTKAQYDYAQNLANTERQRLATQDLAPLFRSAGGWRMIPHGGQSFDATSDNGRLHLMAEEIAAKGYKFNSASVSRDPRCLLTGPAFVTFDADDRKLYPLVENMIAGTNVDRIFTKAQYDRGDYPNNSRGSWPGIVESFIRQWMRRRWFQQADVADTTFLDLGSSWSKTDGLAVEVFDGDGKARALSYVDIAQSVKTTPVVGGAGFTLPASSAMGVEYMPIKHGQADNRTNGGAATSNYPDILLAFYNAYAAKLNTVFGQTAPFAFIQNQCGSPNYGTVLNVCSQQQSDMADDVTGTYKWFFLVSVQTEVPNFWNVPLQPNPNDAHPSLAGMLIMGVRDGVAAHYILDRKQPYFLPKPMDGFYSGKKFLIPVACMVEGLHEAPMMFGVTPTLSSHRGFSFTNSAGELTKVKYIRPVPGDYTLLEGEMEGDGIVYTNGQAGRYDPSNGYIGNVEFRDGFRLELPFDLPFTLNQTTYANTSYVFGVDGNGYKDNPLTNGFGRYIEDIPGWVGKYDWGNPMRIRRFTMSLIPV